MRKQITIVVNSEKQEELPLSHLEKHYLSALSPSKVNSGNSIMNDDASELPRLSEIKKLALDLNSPKSFFQHDDDKFINPNKRPYFVELERDLQRLDRPAWDHLKGEVRHRLTQKSSLRGWQPLIDTLNEAKGYTYLAGLGCTDISFIPRSTTKTPDLQATLGNSQVLCDVKTINISDDEAKRRFEGGVGTTLAHLPAGFFNKLSSDLESASSQMLAFNNEDGVRRLAYIVINSDDCLNEYADDYRTQIETYLTNLMRVDVDVVLDIQSAFSSVRVKAHSGIDRI